MRRAIFFVGICVIFVCCLTVKPVFAFENEQLEFYSNGKQFVYSLQDNIKVSNQFDINFEINKYKRFTTSEQRKILLNKMLNAGFGCDVALNYIFPNLNKTIKRIEKTISKDAKSATVTINSNSEKVFNIKNEVVGLIVDKQKLFNLIAKAYMAGEELNFEVPIIKIMPQTLAQDLQSFAHLRADFSTNHSQSSADRKHNIKNAIMSLNKVEIMPNEVFSFNKTVGRRSLENGYRNAKIIVNNEFVDGIGGGVCQVSSTLYNSALLAGLEIVEANKHSKQVSYVKHGFDAMVNFGSSDLKFRNNTNQKITIIANYNSNTIRIRIFGESLGDFSYKLKNEIFNIQEPNEEVVIDNELKYANKVMFADEFFYLKKASRGMEIKTFREKYKQNNLVSTQLLRHDKFKVQNAVKVYGSLPRVEEFIA